MTVWMKLQLANERKGRSLAMVALAVLGAFAIPTRSEAAVRRLVEVSYERSSGRSDGEVMEVTFMTGKELNKATKSYDYQQFSNYALLWFGEGEVALVEISTFLVGVGEEFDAEDFRKLFRFGMTVDGKQVNSERPRQWYFEGKKSGRWIDPREQ